MFFKKTLIFISVSLIMAGSITGLFAMGVKSTAMVPMMPKKLLIQDREMLQYGQYIGGERIAGIQMVSEYKNSSNEIITYAEAFDLSKGEKLPEYLTNYHSFFRVSLSDASLLESYKDIMGYLQKNNKSGMAYQDIKFDKVNSIAETTSKLWDGNELKISTGKMKIKPGFPVWDPGSIIFIGLRYLDVSGPGIVYLVTPQVLKEPMPVSFRVVKKEVLETKAGKFNTLKISFSVADPFISKLMDSYIKTTFIWVEDSERALIVKTDVPGSINELESVSVYKGK